MMGTYKDITIYCDICGSEGAATINTAEARKDVQLQGWVRRKRGDEWIDVCTACKLEGGG